MKKLIYTILFSYIIQMTQAIELTVMTYNIFGGRLTNGVELAKVIKPYNADFIALQEVDKNTRRSNFKDITKEMADELGYNYYYFQKTLDYDSGDFGIALISKYLIKDIYSYELPSAGIEKRHALLAEIDETVFNKKILFVNTHLDPFEEIKTEQVDSLLSVIKVFDADIKIIGGDFNFLPNSSYYHKFLETYRDTYEPVKKNDSRFLNRIDYIFTSKTPFSKIIRSFFAAEDVEWSKYSDHVPYMTILKID